VFKYDDLKERARKKESMLSWKNLDAASDAKLVCYEMDTS